MKKTRRSIFPVGDAGNDKGDWRFELPRHGRTVLVRSQRSGKVLRKLTWNGEKFVENGIRNPGKQEVRLSFLRFRIAF